jgi:hypothetical protein
LVSAVCQVYMPIAFALEQVGPDVSVEKLFSRSTYLELLNSCKECTVMSKLPGPHPRVEQEGTVPERFQRLAADWKEQTRFLSNSAQMAILKPYQRIIGMGPPVVPLILDELRREPDQWFWALESITEQNPVPPEAMGSQTPNLMTPLLQPFDQMWFIRVERARS